MKKYLTIYLSALFLLSGISFAGTTGKIAGRVTDKATGEGLPFVNVIVEGTNYGAATDIDGNYVILNVPPGRYSVKAQYIGYQPVIVTDVQVSIDLTSTVNFELGESVVELEAVVVEGKKELIKKDITSSQSLISSDQIEVLPVLELNDVLELQAGVTRGSDGSFHIRGGRSSEIAYWVNGISITDGFDNSRGIEIDNSSIQELQVISGTFNAEYGNALSGIINTVTKEGGRDFHGNIKLYSSDYVSNFTDYFTYIDNYNPLANYNIQASLDGPIPFTGDQVTFFANGRYNYDDGFLYGIRKYNIDGTPGDGKYVSMNWSKRWIGQANLSYWVTTGVKLNAELLYSKEDYQNYGHDWKWTPDGNVKTFTNSYNGTLTVTHLLSSSTFYVVKGSYFFRDFNEYLFEDPFDSRYLSPDSLNIVGYAFRTKGTNLNRFFRETNSMIGKVDFTSQVHENHLLKLGFEGRYHELSFDNYGLEPKRVNNVPVEPFEPAIPSENSPNRNKYTNKPIEIAAYVQDKIEFENVIINIGVRFDYFDAQGKVLVDPTDPNIYNPLRPPSEVGLTVPWDQVPISEREKYFYKDSEPKSQTSLRFGIAYPISESGVVHFSYGNFLQIPTFQYLFNNGAYKVPESGSNYGVYGNPDLDAQRTVMYEIGFKQEFMNDFMLDVTGFYRDIRNWITAGPLTATRNLVTYSKYINKDYSNVKGVTLTFNKRFGSNYSFDFTYTYQVAEGSNSSPEDEFFAQQGNNEPALFLLPLDWDQRHLLNLSFFVGGEDWGASLLARYGTGLPYTPAITQYTADRGISSGLQRNSRRRPTQFTMDLKLNKLFDVMGYEINVFLSVFNLLDNRTVVNVFGDTGQPDFTTQGQNVGEDPNRPNTVEEYLRFPWHYGEPRQVQLGFEFSF
ncbi:MAG: TonB-dependent receptor [Ignavibacteriaceae bacterium]|nr:TonB-dependent receptor [Ignavibacteriaceae bacterium]